MSKTLFAIVSIVCIGIGILIGGLGVFYAQPFAEKTFIVESREASCLPREHGTVDLNSYINGIIKFKQVYGKPLKIEVGVLGLPLEKVGFHIHTYAVVNGDCTSAGGHFNPRNQSHGGPDSEFRHLGDLGNVDGKLLQQENILKTDEHASLFGEDSILGRSIVVHKREDDLINQASAGPRIACCTIQHNNPQFLLPAA